MASSCVDRGLLLAELWSGMRRLLVASLADRAAAMAAAAAAQQELAETREAWHSESARLTEDMVGGQLHNQQLSFHTAQLKAEVQEWQRKHAEVGRRGAVWALWLCRC